MLTEFSFSLFCFFIADNANQDWRNVLLIKYILPLKMFPSLLVLLFILKIRLSANSNIVNLLLHAMARRETSYIEGMKDWEETCKNLSILRISDWMKTYNVIPKFLRFKLYKRSLRSASFYRSWQAKLLNYEINCKKKEMNWLSQELKQNYSNVNNLFSYIDPVLIV